MSQLGFTPMVRALFGDYDRQSAETFGAALGKTISAVSLDDALHIRFDDGTGIRFVDNNQSCCESRYMTTDDDLDSHIGEVLIGAEQLDGPDVVEGGYGDVHDTAFLHIRTDRGVITVTSHVEHNGYYGGLNLDCEPG